MRKVKVGRVELDAHEEEIEFGVSVFVGEQDIAIVSVNEVGDARDHPFLIGAVDEQDGGGFHAVTSAAGQDGQRCATQGKALRSE